MNNKLEELLGEYWDCAYQEGHTQKSNGTRANEVLHKIREQFRELREAVSHESDCVEVAKEHIVELEAQLADLRREAAESQSALLQIRKSMNSSLSSKLKFDRIGFILSESKATALQSAIEQAVAPYREDAERLNWLERQCRTSTLYMNGKQPFRPNTKVMGLQGASFRDAIDTARNAP